MSNSSKTDWAKIDAQNDQTINTSEVPPLGGSFFGKAHLRMPKSPVQVTLDVDQDVLAWFRDTGPNWEARIRAALRIYAEAHQSGQSR